MTTSAAHSRLDDNRSLGVVAISFGTAAPEPIPEERVELYEKVAESIGAYRMRDPQRALTIPVSLPEVEKSEVVYPRILDKVRTWESFPDLFLADIINPRETFLTGKAEVHIFHALVTLAHSHEDAQFVVLVESIRPEKEATRQVIEELVSAGRMVLIDRTGRVEGKLPSGAVLPMDFVVYRNRASGDSLNLLRLKMIRRLGHYVRPFDGERQQCVRYFYDGSRCTHETASLIEDHVRREMNAESKPALLFDCPVTRWLEDAVDRAAAAFGVTARDIRDVLERPELIDEEELANCLVVFPLVDTGTTAASVIRAWRERFGRERDPHLLTVLTTQVTNEEARLRGLDLGDGGSIDIKYLMRVRRNLTRERSCILCDLGIAKVRYGVEEFGMLSSYDFWEMVDDAGWKEEDHVPGNRPSMGWIPDFPEMFRENGAWLAHKAIGRLVKLRELDFPATPLATLCPDEKGARTLATYLEVLHDAITVIKVPKHVLDVCRDPSADLYGEAESWVGEQWLRQLQQVAASPLIAVEEFCRSGGTLKALDRLVNTVGKHLAGHLAIVDFNPEGTALLPVETVSLYRFNAGGIGSE